jgi:hypothetical protein
MNLILKSLHCLRWKINILFSFPKIRFPTAVFRLLIFSIFAVSIGLLGQYGNAQTNVDPISLIRLDFETGNLSQWIKGPKTTTAINNCHEHDYPANNNTLEVVKSPVKQNIYALEVTLTKNATIIPETGTTGERAELKYCDSPRHAHLFGQDDDVWYHWYTEFSSTNFTVPTPIAKNNWHVWTQWHGLEGTTNYGVPVGFNLNGELLNLRVLGGIHDSQGCWDIEPEKCGYLWVEPLQKGAWYEILIHIKWSTKNDGLIEGWIKKDNEPIKSFVPYKGNTLNPNGIEDTTVFLKQGLYHKPAINETQILHHDGMVIATCPPNTQFNPSSEKCNATAPTTIIGNDTSTGNYRK